MENSLFLKIGVRLLILILLASCTRNPIIDGEELQFIYEFKGTENMNETLQPVVLQTGFNTSGIWQLNRPNTVAALDGHGHFALITIDEEGNAKQDTIRHNFPSETMHSTDTDPQHMFMWGFRNRGFYIMDLNTGEYRDDGADNGSTEIKKIQLIDPEKKTFCISLHDSSKKIEENSKFNVIYDFAKDQILSRSDYYRGYIWPIKNNRFLSCEYIGTGMGSAHWYISDADFENKVTNKLTKELTKFQIFLWPNSPTFNSRRRLLLGTSEISGSLQYFSAQWNEDFSDVTVEPLLIQKMNELWIGDFFQISYNGNWTKSISHKDIPPLNLNRLVLFRSSPGIPQALSQPVFCGFSSENYKGAFMEHSVWGTCYVEVDPQFPDKLFVYKGNDALQWLADKAAAKLKG